VVTVTTRLPVVLGVAVLLASAGVLPAVADADQPGRFGAPVYLALGDSVAAGVGAQPKVTGYPEQLKALLDVLAG
jgi:hypothetical protein